MKITLSLFVVFVALSVLPLVARAQTGDEILTRHIDAIGGEANWNKINSMKLIGNMSVQGMEMATSRTTLNNKGTRMEFSIMGMDCYVIVTPRAGWMFIPIQPGMDKVKPMPDAQLKENQDRLNIRQWCMADRSLIGKATYAGLDTIESAPCHKVDITGKDGKKQTAYFDANSYYLVRTEMKVKILQDEDERETSFSYSNFKRQPEGIVIPMTESNPIMGGDINYTSVEINKPVSDAVFIPSNAEMK